MPTLVAIRHLAFEDLGLFEPVLRRRGYQIEYRQAGIDDPRVLRDTDLAIVLGGPIGVNDATRYPWLTDELRVLGQRVEAGGPTLGICLGAQLMAAALGAPIEATGTKEIGYSALELTAAGRESPLAPLDGQPVLHWHGDRFDIPDGAVRLAGTPVCSQQAFAVGNTLLGLQFHVEADPGQLERWLIGHACELADAGVDPCVLREDAARYGSGLASRGIQVLEGWLDRLGG
ncbi:glutamine amidotransferase [Propionibacterium cyclohexanicum]|nr:glutamine amidotransferase [Propionibacterium cyclohexanicum]